MRQIIFSLTILLLFGSFTEKELKFNDYFEDKALRLDYIVAGTADRYEAYYEQLKEEPFWGGSKVNLIDKFNFGEFRVLVYDKTETTLLYSRGYSSLFYEWLDTDEAQTLSRSFYESVQMPFPKAEIVVKIQIREKNTNFKDLYKINIDPKNMFIRKDKQTAYKVQKIKNFGDHHKKLDVVIIPDGYTAAEMDKFHKDCARFAGYFYKVEPFKSNSKAVNFWAVDAVSEESGTDVPGKNEWKNTVLDTHFYTFFIERYLTCPNVKMLRDLAAYVPYDQIYILVNTDIYGGGGIYNYYNLCVADHPSAEQVFTHEFGHAFAALADEYEYGYENASDIFDMSVEPWQVNITNLVNFDSKWKNLVEDGTPIPTPATQEYSKKVGAFEGAGYVKKQLYRPTNNCKMRSNSTNDFCPVCRKTVEDLLKFYTE